VEDWSGDQGYFRVTPGKQPRSKRPVVLIVFLAVVFIGAVCWLALNYDGFVAAEDAIAERPVMDASPISEKTQTPTANPTNTETPITNVATPQPTTNGNQHLFGVIVFAARENGNSHLWYYVPGEPTAIRLTTGQWDDRDPSVSPDGSSLAFSSRRDGNWDLFTLDLNTGEIRRLTATMGYEGKPAWSPDGKWLAFEAYYDGNFDIWLLPVDGEGDPYRLTTAPSLDLSPIWDPTGRRIIFSSNRTGNFDIYAADLDNIEDRFLNITETDDYWEGNPRLDVSGEKLAYISSQSGMNRVVIQDLSETSSIPRDIGQGILPEWSPDGSSIAVVQRYPYDSQIISYNIENGGGLPLSLLVQGEIVGIDWYSTVEKDFRIMPGPISEEPTSLYDRIIETPVPDGGRNSLIKLVDLSAPKPLLSDQANEAFESLRNRVARELGWDFLANLDYAFVGITDPLPPGYSFDDWLFTGRAFAFSEAIARAGWVELVKEDVLGNTYWRVYVRSRYQDGSLGEPMRDYAWDFTGRIQGDPTAYDHGGALKEYIPDGYYIDFTSLAADFGFLRQAALHNWRTYYPGSRYTEFALTDGLSWEDAMLELYPRASILTPTPFKTPTPTPTRTPWPTSTPWWWRALTPTATMTASPTATTTPTPTQQQ